MGTEPSPRRTRWTASRFGAAVKVGAANRLVAMLGERGYAISRARFHEENEIDLRVLLALEIEDSKGAVVVLQIGANDGITNDPIHGPVQDRGWTLYAVEPMPGPFARLTQTYAANPLVRCINVAVGPEDGHMPMYSLRADGTSEESLDDHLSSFSRKVLEEGWRHIPDIRSRIEMHSVRSVTLPSLVNEFGIPEIDLLQIDTEGFDFELIKMVFAAGMRPAIIAFEWTHLKQQDMWECRTELINHGYRWLLCKGDVIATRLSMAAPSRPTDR